MGKRRCEAESSCQWKSTQTEKMDPFFNDMFQWSEPIYKEEGECVFLEQGKYAPKPARAGN